MAAAFRPTGALSAGRVDVRGHRRAVAGEGLPRYDSVEGRPLDMTMSLVRKVLLAGLVGAVTMVVAQASAATDGGRFVRCSWRVSDGYPYRGQGTQVGHTTCAKPLGNGHYHGTYKDTVDPPTAGETTSLRVSFKAGTVYGNYELSGVLDTTRYHGTLTITGGTRRFRHATGTLQMSCVATVPIIRCKASGTLTGI